MGEKLVRAEISKLGPDVRKVEKPSYNAVVVLCGNIVKRTDGTWHPTTYSDRDKKGMLGGGARVLAAAYLYMTGASDTFVFSGGMNNKILDIPGNESLTRDEIPTEASVYKKAFLRTIEGLKERYPNRFVQLPEPKIILEEGAYDTESNVKNVTSIIQSKGWQKTAVLSNNHLLERIEDIFISEIASSDSQVTPDYIGAEETLLAYDETRYGRVIFRYITLGNPDYFERLKNEAQGIKDRHFGLYVRDKY